MGFALDLAIVALLVLLAVRLLVTRDLFEAAVFFVAYGLTLALVWVRLGAPDVALAEAALGAGVTGALFLNTFRRLSEQARSEKGGGRPRPGHGGPEPGGPSGGEPR